MLYGFYMELLYGTTDLWAYLLNGVNELTSASPSDPSKWDLHVTDNPYTTGVVNRGYLFYTDTHTH